MSEGQTPVESASPQPTGQEPTAQAPSQEYVSIDDASDQDLEEYLEKNLNKGKTQRKQPAQEPSEKKGPAQKTEGDGTKGQQSKRVDPTKDAAYWKGVAEAEKARAEKLKIQQEQQELFIQRTRNELGEERKKHKEEIALLQARIDDAVDPREIVDLERKKDKVQEKLDNVDQNENAIVTEHENRRVVEGQLKPEELDVEAMARLLAADGGNQEMIQAFIQRPYAVAPADVMIQLGKRVSEQKAFHRLVLYAHNLQKERDSLKAESESIVKGVDRAFKQQPTITASGGSATGAGASALNPEDVENLSDEELAELLAQAGL